MALSTHRAATHPAQADTRPETEGVEDHKNGIILGIGNTLLSDEGTGIWVIEHLHDTASTPPGLELVDGGTLSFTLAPMLEDSEQLIVVDAAELHAPPGTVRVFIGADMDRFSRRARNSVHEVGLSDLLDIARLVERLPPLRALIGIQPSHMDWGTSPSEAVAAAIPQAAAEVIKLARRWRTTATRDTLATPA